MSMKQFTFYHTQVHPKAPARVAQSTRKPSPKKSIATYLVVDGMLSRTGTFKKNNVDLRRGQKEKARAILNLLDKAQKKGIPAPNIDEICNIARTYYKGTDHNERSAQRDEFRKVFETLVVAGYIRKAKV
jgi:hypothetical protein